ncbi:hypothetical protein R3P38DRAFT_3519726 [Favolaschia claudopus]|uniref:Uncharacterized protein n=1 Tax=Favolaschia claudopus TaxID=2862362 RepID=A0AAW0BLS0_9AGAR
MRPVVASVWSEVVDASVGGGFLALAWKFLPDNIRLQMLSGQTPADIERYLPPTPSRYWTPHKTFPLEYLLNVGVLRIVQYGPSPTDIIIIITNLHAGIIKHDTIKAFTVSEIILSGETLYQLTLAEAEKMREEGILLLRSTTEDTWAYFTTLKKCTEARATELGLLQHLEKLKQQFIDMSWALAHLRSKKAEGKTDKEHADDFTIPGITHAVGPPNSASRKQQFHSLHADYKQHLAGSLNPDPFYLIAYPFRHDPFGPDMKKWVLERKEGCWYSNAARVYGSDEESYQRAIESQQALSNNKAALSKGGHLGTLTMRTRREEKEDPQRMLMEFLCVALKWDTHTLAVQDTGSIKAEGWRYALCQTCDEIFLANGRDSYHVCIFGDPPTLVTNSNYPSLRILRFPHHALHVPALYALLSPKNLDSLNMVKVSVYKILSRPANQVLVREELPSFDIEDLRHQDLFIYRLADEPQAAWLEATYTIDVCLDFVSDCPQNLWPTTAEDRSKAYGHKGPVDFDAWVSEIGKERFYMRCHWGWAGTIQPHSGVLDHVCECALRIAEAQNRAPSKMTRAGGGPRDCDSVVPANKHFVGSVFDLPPDYLHASWHYRRVFPKLKF